MKQKQLSLLDLYSTQGVTERNRLVWITYHKVEYERIINDFKDSYGEDPIFWKRLNKNQTDIFYTHPEHVVLVDLKTGELFKDNKLINLAWTIKPSLFNKERRKHISDQMVALLDGRISPEDWTKEVFYRLKFNQDYKDDVIAFFSNSGLQYCLEIEAHKGIIRVFGPPEKLKNLFKQGIEKGILSY